MDIFLFGYQIVQVYSMFRIKQIQIHTIVNGDCVMMNYIKFILMEVKI